MSRSALLAGGALVLVLAACNDTFTSPEPTAPTHGDLASAIAGAIDVSFDEGKTWTPAVQKSPQQSRSRDYFSSYSMPVPEGTTSARFRGKWYFGNGGIAREISIWSLDAS